jgi:hypothetical protein
MDRLPRNTEQFSDCLIGFVLFLEFFKLPFAYSGHVGPFPKGPFCPLPYYKGNIF